MSISYAPSHRSRDADHGSSGKQIASVDSTNQMDNNTNKQHEDLVEKQGRNGQTVQNNLDPARNDINPQLLTESEFLANSLCYGMRVPTGTASTWDRRLPEPAKEFQKALLARYGNAARDFAIANRKKQHEQFGQELADAVGTGQSDAVEGAMRSVNNEFSDRGLKAGGDNGKTKDTSGSNADGSHRFEEGRQRGQNPTEPAHHFATHEPTTWDRIHGGVKVAAGTVRMDQDIKTQGKAEFNGETRDHY
ncbi:hypothetical protein BCR37DRAFT_264284 [Protomyces lactucae-debilis]|uniref:Uncharacterized protein n=1 Tax=Protomyces lactucae-debilis TaxID=2754530 RepID=A0A1Y2FK38_PROLT|nr:uncharacterized protein BCR37DRAFT_264284 [Protomyces lactucae-debilis]ORY84343.1 hypothetical protein BCR37DRAFT_264284 [Protomyces lactucae-debilis]